MKTLLSGFPAAMLCAGAALAQTPAPKPFTVPDTIAQRVQACVACHGASDKVTPGGYFPRIAGKPAGYLYNQLLNFREGRRSYAVMSYMVEHLSDDYLKEIALYFAQLELPYPPAAQTSGAPPALLEQGRALVMEGDAARKLPACTQCHGQAMSGVQPAIAGLIGLPRDYINGQLGAWQSGQRRAHAPDCMAVIAKKLTAQEVSAISTWLSSQQVAAHAAPAAATANALPLECGSAVK